MDMKFTLKNRGRRALTFIDLTKFVNQGKTFLEFLMIMVFSKQHCG